MANMPLAKFTTFKIGGPADLYIEVESEDKLVGLLDFLSGAGVDYLMLGGGSNLLVPDDGFRGVVIRFKNQDIRVEGTTVVAGAGVTLGAVVMAAVKANLTGLEWAMGLPGTVGGAVRGNAGATWKGLASGDTAGALGKVEVWRDGGVIILAKNQCRYGYRDSIFKHNHDVILRAWYNLSRGEAKKSLPVMQEIVKRRNGHYPVQPSAGSFFKNIPLEKWPGDTKDMPEDSLALGKVPAGWMIERAGMKEFAIGGAAVSKEHGNFLINARSATQADMLAVVEAVKTAVYNKFEVTLEEEVQILR